MLFYCFALLCVFTSPAFSLLTGGSGEIVFSQNEINEVSKLVEENIQQELKEANDFFAAFGDDANVDRTKIAPQAIEKLTNEIVEIKNNVSNSSSAECNITAGYLWELCRPVLLRTCKEAYRTKCRTSIGKRRLFSRRLNRVFPVSNPPPFFNLDPLTSWIDELMTHLKEKLSDSNFQISLTITTDNETRTYTNKDFENDIENATREVEKHIEEFEKRLERISQSFQNLFPGRQMVKHHPLSSYLKGIVESARKNIQNRIREEEHEERESEVEVVPEERVEEPEPIYTESEPTSNSQPKIVYRNTRNRRSYPLPAFSNFRKRPYGGSNTWYNSQPIQRHMMERIRQSSPYRLRPEVPKRLPSWNFQSIHTEVPTPTPMFRMPWHHNTMPRFPWHHNTMPRFPWHHNTMPRFPWHHNTMPRFPLPTLPKMPEIPAPWWHHQPMKPAWRVHDEDESEEEDEPEITCEQIEEDPEVCMEIADRENKCEAELEEVCPEYIATRRQVEDKVNEAIILSEQHQMTMEQIQDEEAVENYQWATQIKDTERPVIIESIRVVKQPSMSDPDTVYVTTKIFDSPSFNLELPNVSGDQFNKLGREISQRAVEWYKRWIRK